MKIQKNVYKFIKVIIILFLTLLTSFSLQQLHFKDGNILLIYLLGIVFIVIETQSFLWGIFSSLFFVASFNFFFTDPKHTLMINDKNYIISLIVFIIVSIIVNTLTIRLQKQIVIAQRNEEITTKLYKISTGFLNLSIPEQITLYGERSICQVLEKDTVIYLNNQIYDDSIVDWCLKYGLNCGIGETNFSESSNWYIPLKSKKTVYGVVVIKCDGVLLDLSDKQLVNTISSQITIALERAFLNISEEKNRINIEKEKLKNNLLRSISHDLRTPLTGIAGGADFIRLNYNDLDKKETLDILNDIVTDATWLSGLVENLLNMTRIQDGKLIINYSNEVIDDIIEEVVTKVSKRCTTHKLISLKPDKVILVPMDGQLIIQVLVNLIDNAFKHTKSKSTVWLSSYVQQNCVVFEVKDNGGGINSTKLPNIFDSFYTAQISNSDKQRGMGLGLSICKSIVNAHNGNIVAENNEIGGATFKVILPLEVQNNE